MRGLIAFLLLAHLPPSAALASAGIGLWLLGRPALLVAVMTGPAAGVLLCAVAAIVLRVYHLARGRRSRARGIPCAHCQGVAFPVEGTTTRYRCWSCHSRFDGPEHFD
jgi:hypothetical protein